MAPSLRRIDFQERVLLVEGKDELNFYAGLAKSMQLCDKDERCVHGNASPSAEDKEYEVRVCGKVEILSSGGIDNMVKDIERLPNMTGFNSRIEVFGLAFDQDKHLKKDAVASIQNALRKANLPVPASSGEFTGAEAKPRVGFFVQAPDQQFGSLEDLCLKAVESNPAMPCVKAYFLCLRNIQGGIAISDETKMSKARMRVFLASKAEDPTLSIGVAAKKESWLNFNHEVWKPVKQFLESLYRC
jgi:hypothetical protein